MELRLTDNEYELLAELLQEEHRHIAREIPKAYHYEFKTALRDRCSLLESILQKLGAPVHPFV